MAHVDHHQRQQGLLLGSFIADALSLGVHWIYDTDELLKKYGRVTEFIASDPNSYHPHKQAGDQGHVGDQAIRLLAFLKREDCWDSAAFLTDWRSMWTDYNDYIDKATQTTLANLEAGASVMNAGSLSDEFAAAARIAPLLAFHANTDEATTVQAALEQSMLTHHSTESAEATEFLARAGHRLMSGADLDLTIRKLAPNWALVMAEKVLDQNATAAIAKLGPACPISAALPAVIYLSLKHGDDLETALIENTMAGGDNCTRGLALGMLLGAAHGSEAIPARWRSNLRATPAIEAFSVA